MSSTNLNRNSYFIPFIEVAAKGISFINVLLLVRIFSITDYAQYSYILAIVLWAAVFMDGGINNLIYNKSIQKDLTSINVLFSARIVLSVFIIFILYFIFLWIDSSLAFPAILLTITIFFSSSSVLIKLFARGNQILKVDAISILTEPTIRLLFLMAVYVTKKYIDWEFWQVLLIYLLASVIAFVISYKALFKYFKLKWVQHKDTSWFDQLKYTLKNSKYYLLYYAMFVGVNRVEVIFIERYGTLEQVSIYSSAFSIFQVVQLFFFTIITTQFLTFYNRNRLKPFLFFMVLISSIFAIQIVSQYVFHYLFPVEYIDAQFVLNKLIYAIIPCVLSFYLITKINYENRSWINFVVLGIFLLIKIVFYHLQKYPDMQSYTFGFVATEWMIMIGLLICNKFYESTANQ